MVPAIDKQTMKSTRRASDDRSVFVFDIVGKLLFYIYLSLTGINPIEPGRTPGLFPHCSSGGFPYGHSEPGHGRVLFFPLRSFRPAAGVPKRNHPRPANTCPWML
jgi:hypothetical protein